MIMEFSKKYPWIVVMYVVVLLMIPIKDIVIPHFYGKVVDAIQNKKNLWIPFLIVVGAIILMQLGQLLNDLMEMKLYPEMQKFIRQKIMDSIMSKNDSNFSEQETGMIIAKLVRIPTGLYTYLDSWKMYLIPQLITSVIVVVYFSMFDLMLGLSFCVIIAIVYYVVVCAPVWCGPLANNRDEVFHGIHEEVDDVLRNMISVYNLDQLENEKERLAVISEKYKALNRDTVTCGLKYKFYIIPILIVYICVFMAVCYVRVNNKTLQTGRFVSMFFMMMYMFDNLMGISNEVRDMVTRVSMVNEYAKEVREKVPLKTLDHPLLKATNVPKEAHLYLHRVSYQYDGGKVPVIKDLTLQINYYDRLLLVGRIGSGKTSILRLIMHYHVPQTGELYIKGIPYSSLKSKEIRKHVGYVPQYPILFNRTVYENLVYGHEHTHTREKIHQLLVDLNLEHIFKNLAQGLDTKVGKMGSVLSGGQRQIVWILRVMLQDPECLLLDEPTASIDESTKDIVYKLLKHLMMSRPRTIVMVSHDDYLTSFATRIVEFKDGVILSDKTKSSNFMN